MKLNDVMFLYQPNGNCKIRIFGKGSITDFITRLRYEKWGSIFGNYNVDAKFNSVFYI